MTQNCNLWAPWNSSSGMIQLELNKMPNRKCVHRYLSKIVSSNIIALIIKALTK